MLTGLAAFWCLVKERESHVLVRLLLCFTPGGGCGVRTMGSSRKCRWISQGGLTFAASGKV